MLYDSANSGGDTQRTEWLPSGIMRRSASHRVFVVCLADASPRVELLVGRTLKAKGAEMRVSSAPAASRDGSRVRLVFSVRGSSHVRGAIAGLINLLGSDADVGTVRWESDPQAD